MSVKFTVLAVVAFGMLILLSPILLSVIVWLVPPLILYAIVAF